MRLAISNIAWEPAQDEVIAKLLQRYQIDAIDIAPGKYFPAPAQATDKQIVQVRRWWAEFGIEMTGMQALLFGTTGLNLFGSDQVRQAMLHHLAAVCRIGAGLGATRLVLGSPKNRDCSGLSEAQTLAMALSFFWQLGEIASSYEVGICLEPNPACYGANFMTTSATTAAIVEQVAHPAIRMQFDTGALAINSEDPAFVLAKHASLIGHIHASEPGLLPLGDGETKHELMADALRRHLPSNLISIEMLATLNEPHDVSIERALNVAINHYRG